ncbi:MAG: rane protein [Chitinophagaceae bacterium]|nr:rane protein [Chitinophagaceae bacterium]
MNTKGLMISSSIFLAAAGLVLIFLPDEVLSYLGAGTIKFLPVIFKIAGALFFAFAMLNWMAKANLIGGIYSRPVALGNFTHFAIGALTLLKEILNHQNQPLLVWLIAFLYSIFAVLFGLVIFRNPGFLKK